jgi:hypothetical protein
MTILNTTKIKRLTISSTMGVKFPCKVVKCLWTRHTINNTMLLKISNSQLKVKHIRCHLLKKHKNRSKRLIRQAIINEGKMTSRLI